MRCIFIRSLLVLLASNFYSFPAMFSVYRTQNSTLLCWWRSNWENLRFFFAIFREGSLFMIHELWMRLTPEWVWNKRRNGIFFDAQTVYNLFHLGKKDKRSITINSYCEVFLNRMKIRGMISWHVFVT